VNGYHYATGKYIAFLDHDDLLFEDSISERVSFLEFNDDYGWVCTDAIEFDESGELRLFLDQFPWLDSTGDQFCQLLRGVFPLMSTVMISSEFMRRIGGFNINLNYGDDIELFLRLSLVSKVGVIRKPLSRRRIHATQGVSSTFDRWSSRVRIYSKFKPPVRLNQQQKKVLTSALKHAKFKLGECYWELNDFNSSKKMFLESLGLTRYVLKALLYTSLCFYPKIIPFLRQLR
jgi:glycosyltransferase involved in cell wall biosynthesis